MRLAGEAFQADQRSPHDFVLAAGGRAPPFGDLGDGATAAGADAGSGFLQADVFAGRWWPFGH